jgi:hypothetical protein|tara:strand:- start:39 stop:656 length:618 start_codon:yes stop_codon:yes gene_type:complete
MADTLITGTTIVESSTRSNADIPIGGIIEFDDTYSSLPDGFLACDGSTVNDPISAYNGQPLPNLNTNYWTTPAANFIGGVQDNVAYFQNELFVSNSLIRNSSLASYCPVDLPHGAVVTGVIVYGSETTGSSGTWVMNRQVNDAGAPDAMAGADNGVEDTSISNATIDNSDSFYYIKTLTGDGDENRIYGAKITYTPRFKFVIRIR